MAVDKRATRLGVLALVGVLLFSLVGVRLWFLQTVRAEELQARVQFSKTRTVDLVPERGRIFDADGRIVADNEPILTVAVDYQMLRKKPDRQEIFRRLSGWIDVPIEEMEERYDSGLYSPLLPMPVKEDVDEQTAAALMERIEDFPGVAILNEYRRVYPYSPLAAHSIGYMGAISRDQKDDYLELGYNLNERVGQFGVERSMEQVLHGRWGKRVYEVDAAERPVRLIEEVPPVNGYDIQLTVDLDVQQYAEQALQTQLGLRRQLTAPNPEIEKPNGQVERLDPFQGTEVPFKAPAGSVVVLDQNNGSVIALASYPTFDNRWFEAGLSQDKFQEIFPVTDDPDQSILVNRAIQGRYNMGSTFKPFTAYAAMHSGLLAQGDYYRDEGTYRMYSVDQARCDAGLVRCVYKNATCRGTGQPCRYGSVNVESALAVSSDAFFYRLGEQLLVEFPEGTQVLQNEVKQFGFGADPGVDLPFAFDGTVPDAELKRRYAEEGIISEDEGRNYFSGDNVQLAIGQGLLSASPLQLANGYASIGNGGFVYEPEVVAAVFEPGVPDSDVAGFADLGAAVLHEQRTPELVRQIPMPPEISLPIIAGLQRVIRGPGVTSDFYHATTGENLFFDYPSDAIRIAGKTGTAQGQNNYPWLDSSVFAAFSLDQTKPYTVTAYLEKSGYGSQAAAPVVKCVYLALSGQVAYDPVEMSDPLDLSSSRAAQPMSLRDTSCFNGKFTLVGPQE
jgi:penicillin-binding protein 2